jgi:hypothetical protein
MKLLGSSENIIIKPDNQLRRVPIDSRRDELLKDCIKIVPTRLSNIMYDIIFPINSEMPENISIHFYSDDFKTEAVECDALILYDDPHISDDGQSKYYRINRPPDNTYGYDSKLYSYVGFDSDAIKKEYEFSVKFYLKYSFQIRAGNLQHEFCYQDGGCIYGEGDKFELDNGTEVTVMKIDENTGIVYCAAIGYNL